MSTTIRSFILLLLLLVYAQYSHSYVIDNQALENLYHQHRSLGDDLSIDRQTTQIVNESWMEMSYGDFRAALRIMSVPKLLMVVNKRALESELTENEKTQINYHILRRLRYMKAERTVEKFEQNIIKYSRAHGDEDALYCLSRIHLLRNPKAITAYITGCYLKAQEIDKKIQVIAANQEITRGFFQENTLMIEKVVYRDIRKNEQSPDSCLALAGTLKYVHLKKKAFNYCLDNLGF